MNDYKVTRFVSGLGYYVGIGLIAVFALGGMFAQGIMGLFGGALIGAFFCVPFLMLCEGMHALVTIANNTKGPSAKPANFDKAV